MDTNSLKYKEESAYATLDCCHKILKNKKSHEKCCQITYLPKGQELYDYISFLQIKSAIPT